MEKNVQWLATNFFELKHQSIKINYTKNDEYTKKNFWSELLSGCVFISIQTGFGVPD